jgi:Ca2+-binding EF-hand superfamily protein
MNPGIGGVYNRRMRKLLFFLTVFASPGFAAEAPVAQPDARLKQQWEERFRAADKDGNRALDRAEAQAGLPKVLWRNFDRIDTDADGAITPEELWAMHEREVAEREKRRAQRVGH